MRFTTAKGLALDRDQPSIMIQAKEAKPSDGENILPFTSPFLLPVINQKAEIWIWVCNNQLPAGGITEQSPFSWNQPEDRTKPPDGQ